MKKKLHTRFPAARIKKIMQADEDIGKIAMAVPVLVSKALELFLQDLCDRTYDITLRRGAKTLNSLHLRYCVQSYNEYDFLREIANKVPDYGPSEVVAEDRTVTKRRKADEVHESDEESKRWKLENTTSSGRGRGRARGRGRGRASKEQTLVETKSSSALTESTNEPINFTAPETNDVTNDNTIAPNHTVQPPDLNVKSEMLVNAVIATSSAAEPTPASAPPLPAEGVTEEYPGWSVSDIGKLAIDPSNFVHLIMPSNDDDEDYDEEG